MARPGDAAAARHGRTRPLRHACATTCSTRRPGASSATESRRDDPSRSSRRTPIVDRVDHQPLRQPRRRRRDPRRSPSRRAGRRATVGFDPHGDGSVAIALEPGPAAATPLFVAAPDASLSGDDSTAPPCARRRSRADRPSRRVDGVDIVMIADPSRMAAVLDYVVSGNTRQVEDPAFVAELTQWLRFNAADAAETRDGLYSAASGNPTSPAWLGRAHRPVRSSPAEGPRTTAIAPAQNHASRNAIFAARDRWRKRRRARWPQPLYQRFALPGDRSGRPQRLRQPAGRGAGGTRRIRGQAGTRTTTTRSTR